MSNVVRNIKRDENATVRQNIQRPVLKKADSGPTRRPALGELGNRVKNANTEALVTKKVSDIAEKKPTAQLVTVKPREVKPRVDTWRKETVSVANRRTTVLDAQKQWSIAGDNSASTALSNAQPRLVRAKTLQTAKPSEAIRIQVTSKPSTTVVLGPVKRQESTLSRRSLTKLKAANNKSSKTNLNVVCKDDENTDSSSDTASVDLPPLSKTSYSTILLSEVENVDINDEANPILVSEYVNDIYAYMQTLELQFPVGENYLKGQTEVTPKMHTVLIDWINEVHLQFRLVSETFFITVGIIDRYLQTVQNTTRENLQLVGVTALFIASKYEELYPPEIKDFVYITDDTYSRNQVLEMERHILKTIGFQLGRPVPIHFLRRYSKAVHAEEFTHLMAKYFIELAAVEYSMSHYRPSEVAASALFLSLHIQSGQSGEQIWSKTLQYYTSYTYEHLKPIISKLAQIVRDAPKAKPKAVFTKYRLTKYKQVATRPELKGDILDTLLSNS